MPLRQPAPLYQVGPPDGPWPRTGYLLYCRYPGARAGEFASRLRDLTGASEREASVEVEAAIERLFRYGAWADKYDGAVHHTPFRGVTMAIPEPIGVIGRICPNEAPLLGVIALIAPLIAMGNTVVLVPSETAPLAATDLYQVLDTSDLPGGVVNIVTGGRDGWQKHSPSILMSMRSGLLVSRMAAHWSNRHRLAI